MQKQTVNARINVKEIKKEWLFQGEKGIYLDVAIFLNPEKDDYGNNGMVVQSVPKEVREKEQDLPKEKKTRGPILGNAKIFGNTAAKEGTPGSELPPFDLSTNDEKLPWE